MQLSEGDSQPETVSTHIQSTQSSSNRRVNPFLNSNLTSKSSNLHWLSGQTFKTDISRNLSQGNNILEESYQKLIPLLSQKFQQFKCPHQNQALMICCNIKCQKSALICGLKNCQCNKQHKKCFHYFRAQLFIEAVQRKLQKQNELAKDIDKSFDKLIDQISDFRQKTIKNLKYTLFQNYEKSFIQNVLRQKSQKIKGVSLSSCFNSLQSTQTESTQNFKLKEIDEKVKRLNNQFKSSMQSFEFSFRLDIFSDIRSVSLKNFKLDSQILKSDIDLQTLIEFFPKIKPKKFQLLYRGSQNDNSMGSFHRKCKNIHKTLIIFKTQHEIYGGYTPLCWNPTGIEVQSEDKQKATFIFRLRKQQKYSLTDGRYAIECDSSEYLSFGKIQYPDLKFVINNGYSYSSSKSSIRFNPVYYRRDQNENKVKLLREETVRLKGLFTGQKAEKEIVEKEKIEKDDGPIHVLQWQVFQTMFQ